MEFDFGRIAERKIQEAIDEGAFDNLPGKGQPLDLDDDPLTPPHMRAAMRILKNAGVLPDWMQLEREIDRGRQENAQAWAQLEKEYARRRKRVDAAAATGVDGEQRRAVFEEWHGRARQSYLAALKRVNTDILKRNLMPPAVQRVHVPYRIEEEMVRFDTAFPALPGQADAARPNVANDDREGKLRSWAHGRYHVDQQRRAR